MLIALEVSTRAQVSSDRVMIVHPAIITLMCLYTPIIHRSVLEDASALQKWDIGNIASHIGQLYYHY